MKKLQSSAVAKVCAWVVLLAAALGAGVFGVRAVLSFQSVANDSWQYSRQFSNVLDSCRRELVDGVYLSWQLDALEQQIAAGNANATLRADAEALRESEAAIEERFFRDSTWFRFRLMDSETGGVLGTNLAEGESMFRAVKDIHHYTFELSEESWLEYGYYDPSAYGYNTAPNDQAGQNAGAEADPDPMKLVLEYGVPEDIETGSIDDEFYRIWVTWINERTFFDHYLTGFLNLGALTLLALIWILWTAGHKKGAEGIVITWQERIFFDLYAVVMITAVVALVFCTVGLAEQLYWSSSSVYAAQNEDFTTFFDLGVLGAGAVFAAGVGCIALLLRTFTVRLKARCLGKTTLLCRVAAWMAGTIHDFVRFLPFTWKIVLGFGAYVMVTFFLIMGGVYNGAFMFMYLCLQLALVLLGLRLLPPAPGHQDHRQGRPGVSDRHPAHALRPAPPGGGFEQYLGGPGRGGGREDEKRAV